jgi:hypothetical protein
MRRMETTTDGEHCPRNVHDARIRLSRTHSLLLPSRYLSTDKKFVCERAHPAKAVVGTGQAVSSLTCRFSCECVIARPGPVSCSKSGYAAFRPFGSFFISLARRGG